MIRGEIQIQAETVEELQIALRTLVNALGVNRELYEPGDREIFNGDLDSAIILAEFGVLPEYRERDLEKFIGCDPNLTGDLSTEEYIDKIRGK